MAFPDSWSITSKNYSGTVKNQWLKGLGDKRVLEVTQEALKNNYDLQASALLLETAKEGTIIGRAARFPSINLSGSGSRSRNNEIPAEYSSNYGLSLAASW